MLQGGRSAERMCDATLLSMAPEMGRTMTPGDVQRCVRELRWPFDGREPMWIAFYGDSFARKVFFDTAEMLNSSSSAPLQCGDTVRTMY